jgi:hypothetical protein
MPPEWVINIRVRKLESFLPKLEEKPVRVNSTRKKLKAKICNY